MNGIILTGVHHPADQDRYHVRDHPDHHRSTLSRIALSFASPLEGQKAMDFCKNNE